MCGRYITPEAAAVERAFRLHNVNWKFEASYNVAPTQKVPIVRQSEGGREGLMVRWGLIPFFAKGEPPKFSCINTRIETLETAPSYRGPWKRGQRCLQVASGFYEWHLSADGRKAPYVITVADQDVFGFAGLWDRSFKADGTAIESCVHVTMPANELMREIHNTGKKSPSHAGDPAARRLGCLAAGIGARCQGGPPSVSCCADGGIRSQHASEQPEEQR